VILAPETRLHLNFSLDDGHLKAEGSIVRADPGVGLAIKFKEVSREERVHLQEILDFVDESTKLYDSQYISKLLKK
jgi:hypothetical protein